MQTVFMLNSMHANAIAALSAQVKKAKSQYSDLQLSEVVECKNLSCITATETYTLNRIPSKAKFYIQTDPRQIVIRSYHAPVESYEAERSSLLEVMTNIRLGRPGSEPVPLKTPPPEDEQAPVQEQLVSQKAPDGSVGLDVPANWNVQGDNGNMTATDPGTGVGVVFNNFRVTPNGDIHMSQPGVIVSPYQSSAAFIMPIFRRYGYRDAKILYSTPNRAVMNRCPGGFGGRDATDFTMSWVSPQGIPCMGGFTVINGPPGAGGVWNSTISGAWAPAATYGRWLPTLSRVANSFYVSGPYAGYYARNSMSNLAFFHQHQRVRRSVRFAGSIPGPADDDARQHRLSLGRFAARQCELDYADGRRLDVSRRRLFARRIPGRHAILLCYVQRRPLQLPIRNHARTEQLRNAADPDALATSGYPPRRKGRSMRPPSVEILYSSSCCKREITPISSSVVTSPFTSPLDASSRRRRRMILPERVFGNWSVNRMSSGLAIEPISFATQARSSSFSSGDGW